MSMQVFAIGTGSFWGGGIIMLMFALGTLPVLMGLGIASNRFKNVKIGLFKKVAGLAILFFAFYTLASGLAIQGLNLNLGSGQAASAEIQSKEKQVINMTVSYRGYSPSSFKLERGVPVEWRINVTQLSGCNNAIISPSFGIEKPLKSGMNIVEFTPNKTGAFGFSCWMGMIRGKFIVTD